MSWVSTRTYYDWINRLVQRRTEPLASAPLIIDSLDFRRLHGLHEAEDWARAARVLRETPRRVGGALSRLSGVREVGLVVRTRQM